MEGYKGNQKEVMPGGKFGKYKAKVEESVERRERLALRNTVESGKDVDIHGGLGEGIGMTMCLHGPVGLATTLKLRFRVCDLDLLERRKRYTSSREEEEVDAQMRPCSKATDSRTHIYSRRM